MQFQIDVSSSTEPRPPVALEPLPQTTEAVELLRSILEVQREILSMQKAAQQAQDAQSRWRSFLNRWKEDYPGLGESCRHALPVLERTYAQLIADLTTQLNDQGSDALDNDFTLQEFLDRYGMKLAQLGTLLNLVGPLAEAGASGGSS